MLFSTNRDIQFKLKENLLSKEDKDKYLAFLNKMEKANEFDYDKFLEEAKK